MLLLALLACDREPVACAGERLFGAPNANTGLDASRCAPECVDCGGEPWGPPTYATATLDAWRQWRLLDPPAIPAADPYAAGEVPAAPGPDAVCAFAPAGSGTYRLRDFDSTTAALDAGAKVTHYGRCGTCSTLQDLAVYAGTPDLTEPVQACGLAHWGDEEPELAACIAALGFTEACAHTWAWNTLNTREACLSECLAALDQPYHEADGQLNACLQCDEDQSGPIFAAVAGRTRRNTGLASSMCRPCAEVRPLVHDYGAPGG